MIVTQSNVTQAMAYYEKKHISEHGPLDGVTLPRACAKLADLLGVMWYEREDEATIADDSELGRLMQAAA